jgi:hypothetical protein
VCSAMGAGKAHLFDWTPLAGTDVILITDLDEPGYKLALDVARLLDGQAASVKVVRAKVGKDAADHIAAGHGLDEFLPFILPGLHDDDQPPSLAVKLLTRAALKELPTPTPLIDNVLDKGTVALLYGKWGTGKSFIALDWGASIATGRNWQNRQTQRLRVLYIAAEGAFGLQARVTAWETGWQRTIGDDDLSILPCAVNLTDDEQVAELAELVEHGGYGLVIIDTLARCMVGADENSAKDCGEVVDALTRLREATPGGLGVVLAVHHTGKDGKTFRGSSVFEAGADTVYAVTEDGGTITLDREKRKDGPKEDTHELCLQSVDESCVVSIHRDGPHVDMPGNAEKLLALFASHFSETGATQAQLRDTAKEQLDMGPSSFHRAVTDLLKRDALRNTGSKARPFLELVK